MDAAAISGAIRQRLRARGELGADEVVRPAVDNRGMAFDLPIATGDRLRLFRKTAGTVDGTAGGRRQHLGSNGQVVEVLGQDAAGLRLQPADKAGAPAVHVPWERLTDRESGRVLLGFGHCLTIDSAQGITAGEHINAMPRGSAGVTAFKAYVAESRHVSQVWTMVAEAAEFQAERASRPLGDPSVPTPDELWARVARAMSEKPYKALGMDLLDQILQDQQRVSRGFMAGCERVQRKGARRNLAADVAAHVAEIAQRRSVAGQLGAVAKAVAGQREAVEVLARSGAAQVKALGSVMNNNLNQAAERAALRRWPEPHVQRYPSPSPF